MKKHLSKKTLGFRHYLVAGVLFLTIFTFAMQAGAVHLNLNDAKYTAVLSLDKGQNQVIVGNAASAYENSAGKYNLISGGPGENIPKPLFSATDTTTSPTGKYPYLRVYEDGKLVEQIQDPNMIARKLNLLNEGRYYAPPADPNKINEDKCVLITPGMSHIFGNMYGEPMVKAENDKHEYRMDLPSSCGGGTKEKPTPTLAKIDEIPAETCVYAVDRGGQPASRMEQHDNFLIRSIQAKEKEEGNRDLFSVTMDWDWGFLLRQAIDEITPNAANQSNETIIRTTAIKGGGNVMLVPSSLGPTKEQIREYWFNSSKDARDGTPSQRGYTVGEDKKMKTGAPYIVNQKAVSLNHGEGGKKLDVTITENCDFQNNDDQLPIPPKNNPFKASNFLSPSVASVVSGATKSLDDLVNSVSSSISKLFGG